MKDTKKQGRFAENIRFTLRITSRELTQLDAVSKICGLSRSEYVRRKFLGGTITAYTDLKTINELRKIGGLLKSNFETMRQANAPPNILKRQEYVFQMLEWMIGKLGRKIDDRKKNQKH